MKQPGQPPCGYIMKEQDVILPTAPDLLVRCYTFLVQKKVRSLIQCVGCDTDHPSQKHHLNGYLMSQKNAVLLYEDACEKIDMTQVMDVYTRARNTRALPSCVKDFDISGFVDDVTLLFDFDDVLLSLYWTL